MESGIALVVPGVIDANRKATGFQHAGDAVAVSATGLAARSRGITEDGTARVQVAAVVEECGCREHGSDRTRASALPTTYLRPVPMAPSLYPRTLVVPPMANASQGGKSPMTLPPLELKTSCTGPGSGSMESRLKDRFALAIMRV